MADFDWHELIKLAAPLVGSIASGPHAGIAMQAFEQGRAAAREEKLRRDATALQQKRTGADFLLKAGEHAQTFTDPTDFENFLNLVEQAGTHGDYIQPGEARSALHFNTSGQAKAQLKELTDQLDALTKNGYDLDQLADGNAQLELKNGKHVSVGAALDMTRQRPVDADGAPIPKPKKTPADAKSFQRVEVISKGKRQYANYDPKTGKYYGLDGSLLVDITPPEPRPRASGITDATGADPGALTDDGLDYAATQFRITGTMPSLGMGKTPDRGRIINRAAAQAKSLAQTPVAAIQKQAAFKADGAALTQMRKMSSSAQAFESKALSQAEIVRDLSAKVSRTQWPLINQAILAGKIDLLGDRDAQLLANAIQTYTAEYAKIMEGSTGSVAASSDSARKAADRLISAKLNKGTLGTTLDLMAREMQLTMAGYDVAIDTITQRMQGSGTPAPSDPAAAPATGTPLTYQDYLKAKGGTR